MVSLKKIRRRPVLTALLALALILTVNLSWADDQTPYGMTYGQWGAAWWQWVNVSPFSKHPLLDTTGKRADINQIKSAFVFFLGGTWTGSAPVTRTVTVSAKQALFFPIFNWVLSYPEDVFPEFSTSEEAAEAWIRQTLNDTFDGVNKDSDLYCAVDGVQIASDKIYRAQSPAFSMYLPADCFEVIKDRSVTTGLPYQAGFHYPSVSWLLGDAGAAVRRPPHDPNRGRTSW